MAAKEGNILEGIGGDILNPRVGGGAYDDMLRALHDVMGQALLFGYDNMFTA